MEDMFMAPALTRYMIMADIKKAYDNVDLDVLWHFIV
jgi:hypothetical protein